MRRSRKGFEYAEGIYYFTIKNHPYNITMHRKNKNAAVNTFQHYQDVGKEIVWLGKWNGKTFVEDNVS